MPDVTPHWIEVEDGDVQRASMVLPDGIYAPAAALDDLRAENERLRAFALGGAPEWERANCSLKHEARELRADLDVAVRERDEARAERDRLRADLALIAETDPIDAVLDPDRALRVARAALAVPAPPTTTEKNDE